MLKSTIQFEAFLFIQKSYYHDCIFFARGVWIIWMLESLAGLTRWLYTNQPILAIINQLISSKLNL